MPEGLDTASFEFYEGVRIVVPGALTLGLIEGVTRTFSANGDGLGLNAGESLIVTLLLGLFFYYVDAPTRAAVFFPLLPTTTLRNWGLPPRHGGRFLSLYLYLLDTEAPPAVRARALYMGSMYRIGFEAIYLVAATSLGVLTYGAWSTGHHVIHREDIAATFVAAALLPVGAWLFALWRDRPWKNDEVRESPDPDPIVAFSWIDVLVMLISVVAFGVLLIKWRHVPGWSLLIPIGIVFTLWAVRYFRGYKPEDKLRQPVAASHACLILGVSQVMVLLTTTIHDPIATDVSDAEQRIWFALMGTAAVLVCARGHERRLRGTYTSQNTWLTDRKEHLVEGYLGDAPAPSPPPTKRRRWWN